MLCVCCSYVFIEWFYFRLSAYFVLCFFFFKQKTAYEMRISDWSSDVCSSDLVRWHRKLERHAAFRVGRRVDVRAADRVPDLRAGGGSGLVHIISFARRERLHRYQPIRASASSRTWDIRIPVTGRSRGAIQLKDGTDRKSKRLNSSH